MSESDHVMPSGPWQFDPEVTLEGVLVPVTARWNEELLHEEGFRSVDCFWRHLNFAGWVAVKP